MKVNSLALARPADSTRQQKPVVVVVVTVVPVLSANGAELFNTTRAGSTSLFLSAPTYFTSGGPQVGAGRGCSLVRPKIDVRNIKTSDSLERRGTDRRATKARLLI